MADLDLTKSKKELLLEIAELKNRLGKAEITLHKIQREKTAKIEDKFSLVYASMSDGLAIHEIIYNSTGEAVDYLINEVNPSFEKITGLLKKDILGKKATVVYGVKEAPYIEIYSKVVSTGIPTSFETYFPPMNKHFHVSVFSPSKGTFATVFQDITERKLADENMQKLSLIQENMSEGLMLFDRNGNVIYQNPASLSIHGYNLNKAGLIENRELQVTWKGWDENGRPLSYDEWPMSRVIHGERFHDQVLRARRDDTGHEFYASYNGCPVYDEKGNINFSFITIHDITSRRNAEESLAFQSRLLSDVHDAVFSSDYDYTITYWNKAAEKMIGWTKEEALGKNSGELLKPIVEDSSRDHERSKLRIAGHWEGEVQYIRKDGTYFFAEVNSTVLKDDNGKDIGNIVIARDITGRKQAEEALKNSERRYSTLFANKINGMSHCRIITNDQGLPVDYIIVQINEAYERIIGIKKADIEGRKVTEVFPDIKNYACDYIDMYGKIALEGGEIKFEELFEATGQILSIYAYSPVPGEFIAIFTDVTERKVIEEKLRESENRFRNLVKNAPTAIYEMDFKTRKFISVNDAMCELSGYSRDELLAIDSLELLEEESKNLFLSRVHQSLKGQKQDENVEYKVKSKDGRLIDAVLNMKFNFNENGIPVGALVVGHDITQRKKATEDLRKVAEALKESEERFRALTENIPDMILRFDKDLRLLYANKAVLNRTGLPMHSLLGKTSMEYSNASANAVKWERAASEVIRTGETGRLEQTSNWQGISLDYDIVIVPEKDINGDVKSVISIARDITEKKLAENKLRESEQRLKYHLDNSPLAVVEWDKDFKIIQWSNEAEKIFGLTREETLGVPINSLDIIYEEDIAIVENTIERLVSGKEIKVISQNRNYNKNRDIIECTWYNSVLLDENGEMSSVLSLVEDVTLLKKTRESLLKSRERYKELGNQCPEHDPEI